MRSVDVASLARTRIVVYPPGLGDEVQALKAGMLEIADILVVKKPICRAQIAPRAICWRCPRGTAPKASGR